MKLKKSSKKIFALCMICASLLSMSTMVHAANESTELVLNHGVVAFNTLMVVEDGVTYIPLRLAFNLNANETNPGLNPDYGINIKPFIGEKRVELSMRRKDSSGNLINEGRFVEIRWTDDVKADQRWIKGRLHFIKYNVIDGRNQAVDEERPGLDSEIKLIRVDETGDRLFLSLTDIEKIVEFMTDGQNYQVDIINE